MSSVEDFRVLDLEGKGAGLFATRPFERGEGIYAFDYWSKEVMPMHLTNHSCDPNGSFNEKESWLRCETSRQVKRLRSIICATRSRPRRGTSSVIANRRIASAG